MVALKEISLVAPGASSEREIQETIQDFKVGLSIKLFIDESPMPLD